jgi:hypothetical protein
MSTETCCDNCRSPIDTEHEAMIRVDYRPPIVTRFDSLGERDGSKYGDFCSWNCAIAWADEREAEHKRKMGERISAQISADPVEAEKLRTSIKQTRAGETKPWDREESS